MSSDLKEIGLQRYLEAVADYNRYFAQSMCGAERPDLAVIIQRVLHMASNAMSIASEFDIDLDDPEVLGRLLDPRGDG